MLSSRTQAGTAAATGTSFERFVKAVSIGDVFYDPGANLKQVDGRTKVKPRNQFRVVSRNITTLYEDVEVIDVRKFV